ncbi:MAG: RdgB/HAM1 family non-canonical purine NTP pyrophosphatase [Acidobacteria bacterium]|nr:RdgB/HAM1 family non-canonical purine NTP pyrophosphatase [Acidobacteriota bacterium]
MSKRLLVATRNPGKFREFAQALRELPLELASLQDLPPVPEAEETGAMFADNARLKAHHYHLHTGWMAVADDSGLEVDALQGLPGVRSARFAGKGASDSEKIHKLLESLRGVPPRERTARFSCALSLVDAGREIFFTEQRCEGRILEAPRGTAGFGYDPVFLVPELGKTFGQLTPAEKNRYSHRGRALEALRRFLVPLASEG